MPSTFEEDLWRKNPPLLGPYIGAETSDPPTGYLQPAPEPVAPVYTLPVDTGTEWDGKGTPPDSNIPHPGTTVEQGNPPIPGQNNPPPGTDPGDGYVPYWGTGTSTEGGGGGWTPPNYEGNNIWEPVGYGSDVFNFDTRSPNPGTVPQYPWYTGDGGPNLTTQPNGDNVYDVWEQMNAGSGILSVGGQFTQINPDGSITPGDINPTIRQVTDGERTAEQLSALLNSNDPNAKFIQDARRQGLEQANAVGGLGGTVGVGAAMQAALRTALPIAQSDAEAFRAAASQNMQALNQFSQLNAQRATQLELAQIDARTRQQVTQIGTSAQMAAAQLQSATQRDLGRLDSETKLRITEIGGKIQDRLAAAQFQYTALLNDAAQSAAFAKGVMEGEYGLAGTSLQGQFGIAEANVRGAWEAQITEQQFRMNQEINYAAMMTGAFDSYMSNIAGLNGIEMDNAARQAAIATIEAGFQSHVNLINRLYPNMDPINFGS